MTKHARHNMHDNSLTTYADAIDKLSDRKAEIFQIFRMARRPLQDRDVMRELKFSDPNMVRPRITELVKSGYLAEVGKVRDCLTGRTVRLCAVCGP